MSWACSVAQVAVTCSENLLQYLRQDLPATLHPKTRVSHYGVDVSTNPSSDRFGSEPLPPNFIFLPSRLVAKKSVDVAIRAVALLKKRGRGVHLAIAGEGPLRAQLQALASDLDLSRDVSFLGSVSHRAAQDLMSQAAFVVVPSSWEAFGQVCLEAMAAAKAVVGSNNGGIGEIVLNGTTGLLVPPHDPDSLAAAIDKLAGDPGLSRQMGLAGRRRVEAYFTWAQMVDRYEQSFAEARRLSRVHRGSLSG
jgi:glycogen(starch) synthase